MGSGLTDEVAKWIATQGYPLEMRVARAFQRQGFEIAQSEYFEDEDTGQLREIDVTARLLRLSEPWGTVLRVAFMVECKLGGSKPWVAFTSARQSPIFEGRLVVERAASPAGFKGLGSVSLQPEVQQMRLFRLDGRPAYGLTQAHSTGADHTYKALLSATKAAAAEAVRWGVRSEPRDGKPAVATVAFPIVVVDSPLVECYLDEHDNVRVEETGSVTLAWPRPYTNSQFAWPLTFVHVVTSDHLPGFVDEVGKEAEQLLILLGGVRELGN